MVLVATNPVAAQRNPDRSVTLTRGDGTETVLTELEASAVAGVMPGPKAAPGEHGAAGAPPAQGACPTARHVADAALARHAGLCASPEWERARATMTLTAPTPGAAVTTGPE